MERDSSFSRTLLIVGRSSRPSSSGVATAKAQLPWAPVRLRRGNALLETRDPNIRWAALGLLCGTSCQLSRSLRAQRHTRAQTVSQGASRKWGGRQEEFDGEEDEFESEGNGAHIASDSVVKVFVTTSPLSYLRPWTKHPQASSTGSAFPIKGHRLVTNAHVVRDATSIRVRRRGDYRKYVAHVEHACPLRDLALLIVEASSFWDGLQPLELDDTLPDMQAPVSVIGYPGDSDNVCITQGIVSRVDMLWYTHDLQFLAVQIDAAINPGNSGGPVIGEDGQCVGVAFEKDVQEDVENVGYIIPSEVVQHFLGDVTPSSSSSRGRRIAFKSATERRTYQSGVGCAGFSYQLLESRSARLALGLLAEEDRGVRIRHVDSATPAVELLKEDDVLLAVDGVDVGCDGTVPLPGRPGERVKLQHLTSRRRAGDVLRVDVWRADAAGSGQQLQVDLPLARPGQLVPSSPSEPEYLMVAGLVFVPLTEPYLEDTYGHDWQHEAPGMMSHLYDLGERQKAGDQVLVLAHALCAGGDEAEGSDFDDDEVTTELQDSVGQMLRSFNGQEVRNLHDLEQMVRSGGRWLRFQLANKDVVVVDGLTADARRERVMAIHRIQKPMHLASHQ